MTTKHDDNTVKSLELSEGQLEELVAQIFRNPQRLQVSFGEETARIYVWQVVERIK